ncbi:MAG: DUF1330 domain-containing protein [Chloroflexi bacterium]|nr:DUF1330 domain-containing protein [Chloroflexota bacterium]
MKAYIIVDVEVNDPAQYSEYKDLAQSTVPLYGGKYIARGGKTENLEGSWQPKRIVILEFPSYDHAKAWLNSPEYAPARSLRHQTATSQMVVVEGLDE